MVRLASNAFTVSILAALAFVSLGCGRSAKAPEEKSPPAPVKWESPRQLVLEEWIELVGSTQPLPDHAARLTAPVGGVVMSVLAPGKLGDDTAVAVGAIGGCALNLSMSGGSPIVEGQMIRKGDVLAQLDATAILAALAKAQAMKKVLQAEREVILFNVKQASLELKRLEELARQPEARTPGQIPLVSPVMLEKAGLALESAQASLRADNHKLEAADKEEAALEMQIRLYTLTAPRKGTLGRLQVVIGQTLPAGAHVAEIVDIAEEIDVLCFVSPGDVSKLQLGQSARNGGFEKSSAGEGPEGKVVYIADQAEADSGLFAVKIRFPNTDLKLRASSVARVSVLTNPGKFCWAVRESAVLEDKEHPEIVVVEEVEEKGEKLLKARRLRAETGIRDRRNGYIEIIKVEDPEKKWHGELNEELNVIFEKGQSLQTGDVVKLEEEDDDEAAEKPEEKP